MTGPFFGNLADEVFDCPGDMHHLLPDISGVPSVIGNRLQTSFHMT